MASGTVLVNLKKDWFGPDGSLYQARDNPHEFPAAYADPPEKSKEDKKEPAPIVVAPPPVSAAKPPRYAVLPSTAEIVESSDTVITLQNTGGGQQVQVPTAVEGDVEKVGGAIGKHGLEEPAQTVSAAAKVAKDAGIDQVGGKPRESGPLPAGTKKPA
jgi:hypothetical protein